jgi:hypothetical protein
MKTNTTDQPATRKGLRVQRLVRLFLSFVAAVANAACIAAIVLWCLNSMGFWAMLGVSIAGGVAQGVISGCLKGDAKYNPQGMPPNPLPAPPSRHA